MLAHAVAFAYVMLDALAVTSSPFTTPDNEIVPVAVFVPSYTLPTLLSLV